MNIEIIKNKSFFFCVDHFVFLHEYFKVDGTSQGFPMFSIHASNELTSKPRFDWVTVKSSTTSMDPCQICCLWELRAAIDGELKSVLLFSAITTKNVTKRQKIVMFPKKCYDLYGKQNVFKIITDFVDNIIAPCYIIPTSIKYSAYFDVLNLPLVCFYFVPYEFFFRDDWGETDIDLTKTKVDTIQNSIVARSFALVHESNLITRANRREMTTQILDCIQANENDEDDNVDEDIILQGVLRAR